MSKFRDALTSQGKTPLSVPLDELKRQHIKVKEGKVQFTPPRDLEADIAGLLQQSVKALNNLVAKGLVKVDANGKVEVVS